VNAQAADNVVEIL